MKRLKKTQNSLLLGGCILLFIMLSILFGEYFNEKRLIIEQPHTDAKALFDCIVHVRRWSSTYGGVYARKGPGVESNLYLKNPDIETKEGELYTLKNPATMLREISRFSREENKYGLHISSLNPMNPDNEPDSWERKAFKMFETGLTEVSTIEKRGKFTIYRLMKPLLYEKSCDMCHADLELKVGDVRGGVSIALPYDATVELLKNNQKMFFLTSVCTIISFCLVLYFFIWRLMNQLVSQTDELSRLDKLKNKFISIAAHDLRNPIGIFKGYLELFSMKVYGEFTPDQKDIIDKMYKTSNNMLDMVNDFLDISTIESGKLELRKEEVHVKEHLQEIYESSTLLTKSKSITLNLDIDEEVTTTFYDKQRIEQVVSNFITNAIKFSYSDSNIKIKAFKQEGELIISVTDHGQGIPTTETGKLFSAYETTSVKPTGNEKSTGIGLFIAKQIIEAHGGRIWVESVQGEGSAFMFSIPL